MILDPTDQRIRDQGFNFVPFDRYLASPFQIPTIDPNTGSGITSVFRPRSVLNQGNQMSFTNQGVAGLVDDFTTTTRNKYFDRQPTPLVDNLRQSKLDRTFMGFPSYREIDQIGPFTPYSQPMDLDNPAASIENIRALENAPLELTTAGRIQSGLGRFRDAFGNVVNRAAAFGPISFVAKSLDKFSSLPETDQAFINMNLGYTGPTVFGENTSGLSKDPYGINTRSAFGNYAEYVRDKADEYSDIDDEEYEQLSKFQKQKVDFYRQQQKKLAQIEKQKQQQQYNEYVRSGRQAEVRDLQARIDRGDFNRSAPDRDLGSVTEASAAASKGVGGGGYTSKDDAREAARGRYMVGGLADLVDIYD